MHTIKLWRDEKSWNATHSDPAITEAFGTDTLPTAWTAAKDPQVVLAEVTRLNPACEVSLVHPLLHPYNA